MPLELIDKDNHYMLKLLIEKKFGCFHQLLCVLIYRYEEVHQDSKFLVKQFSTFNIAHLSIFFVKFNLIMMSKPKYIVILTGLFCSVVAGSTSHFYSFFSVNILARVDVLV